jgi:hypothetical protein
MVDELIQQVRVLARKHPLSLDSSYPTLTPFLPFPFLAMPYPSTANFRNGRSNLQITPLFNLHHHHSDQARAESSSRHEN